MPQGLQLALQVMPYFLLEGEDIKSVKIILIQIWQLHLDKCEQYSQIVDQKR